MTGFDLGQVGYTLEEFFLESTATCYEPAGPTGADGYWQVTPEVQAPLVFVGYGLKVPETGYDDLARLDLQGKIAVILTGSPANGTDTGSAPRLQATDSLPRRRAIQRPCSS